MNSFKLFEKVNEANFDEAGYLRANPDVLEAVRRGDFVTGREHFDRYGKNENRCVSVPGASILEAKRKKLQRIRPLLRKDMPFTEKEDHLFDFMSEELRSAFGIIDTNAVSSNRYDDTVLDLINTNNDKLILDCGAGWRLEYYDNVVNFEIVGYDTTDVLGVGEKLPFIDNAFDAVVSLSVLEHVKDPFQCAREITRVLKPGGTLICSVPFLQPFHAYPHHYYNMTSKGLENLFSEQFDIDSIEVPESVQPIWSLTWILRSWADGLAGKTKEDFLQMKVSELLESGEKYYGAPYVTELSKEKNLELASANVLIAHKKRVSRRNNITLTQI